MAENRFLDKDGLSILVTKIKTELDNVDDVLLFKGIVNDAEVLQGSAASISQISYISSKKVFVGYNKPSYYNNWGTRAKYCNEAGTPIGGKIFIDVDTYKVYTWNGGDLREVLGKDLATINRVLDSLPADILTGISATTDAESITLSFAAAGKGSKGDYGAANAKEIVLNPATPNDAGLMSAADKKKIDKAATLDEQGKVPSSQLPSFVDDVQEFQGFVENVTLTDTPPVVLSVIIGIYYDVSRKVFITKVRNGETEVYTSKMFPSFVDKPTSPTPLSGKIYVDQSTNKTYRWSGSNLVEISASLALGETENTAFAGDRGVALEGEVADLKESVKTKADKDFVGNNLNSITKDISKIKASAIKNIRPSYDATHVNLSQEKIEGAAVNISIDTATSSKAGAMSAADKEKLDNFIDSEGTRNRNETARISAESGRAAAETARVKAETARADAETRRAAAETKRETDFSAKVGEVDTAVTNANTATSEAEKVDATITEANVFEVTGRDGVKKSLELVGQAEADVMKKDVDRIKESMGAYSDRPNITLAAKENNVAISADGVKVPKSGWAIAEFTAELGNIYLFNPGETSSDVCVFAEYIDKRETRAIDYAYTYDESGRVLTAKATYNGKTYTYTYDYTSSITTITDRDGNSVSSLPSVYTTTVGTYQPMTILNANAELPVDGYCRFVSNFTTASAIKIVVSYKVSSADLTMKVVRDGSTANMCSQLAKINKKVDDIASENHNITIELCAKKDTKIDVNNKVVEIKAHKAYEFHDFNSFSLSISGAILPDPFTNITRFKLRTNGKAKPKMLRLCYYYSKTEEYPEINSNYGLSIEELDVSKLDTSEMFYSDIMFSEMFNIRYLDVSSWDTKKFASLFYMFRNCQKLDRLDVSGWVTSNVDRINGVFQNCFSLTALDVSSWDTSQVYATDHAFEGCKSLTTLTFGENFGKMKDMCSTLDLSDLSAWKNDSVKSLLTLYDRKANGMGVITIKLHANAKAVLGEDGIAQLTAKGYTIA